MVQKLSQIPQRFQLMLQKAPKDLNKTELSIMGPLSRYNYWLAEARSNAAEILKYQRMLETSNSPEKIKDLTYIVDCRKSAYDICVSKAKEALKEAYSTEKLQAELEAKRKAEREKERNSFRKKQKAEAKAETEAEAQVAEATETEDSDEPAA